MQSCYWKLEHDAEIKIYGSGLKTFAFYFECKIAEQNIAHPILQSKTHRTNETFHSVSITSTTR